jgi:hypothetical protein
LNIPTDGDSASAGSLEMACIHLCDNRTSTLDLALSHFNVIIPWQLPYSSPWL